MASTPGLRLYNTLTRAKQDFVPLDVANVRMYVCGPTVYDYAHIGNARPVIVFDVLYRLLRHLYGEKHVTYVRNITDIDDKINKRALERWTKKRPLLDEVKALTQVTAQQYEADVAALGCLPPTHAPRATDFVCDGAQPMDMVRVIERLVAKGFAYAAEGHVLFEVAKMPNYGKLSRRSLDEMVAGARVEVAPYKKNPMDFVLWKPSDPTTEPGWDSPWGFGRPGWHIECSAMSGALLGEQFDIHAGGIDLIFPHHENEIAQTCCAFGVESMASVWMHNGFLQVEGQKMSKSAGNFFTIREVLQNFHGRPYLGRLLRWVVLQTHYRAPLDWTLAKIEEARKEFGTMGIFWRVAFEDRGGLFEFLKNYDPMKNPPSCELMSGLQNDLSLADPISSIRSRSYSNDLADVRQAVSDLAFLGVLNEKDASWLAPLPKLVNHFGQLPRDAMVVISKVGTDISIAIANEDKQFLSLCRKKLNDVSIDLIIDDIGLIEYRYFGKVDKEKTVDWLVEARLEARRAKNFTESDRLRDELLALGIQLMDGKDPVTGEPTTTWEVKR